MGVFNDFKKDAYMELEKEITSLERGMPDKDDMMRFEAKVQFAQRINLININKAREYRKRASALEYTRRTETGIIDDGFENPLEREIRFSSMEALKKEIATERSNLETCTQHENCSKTPGHTVQTNSEQVHSR